MREIKRYQTKTGSIPFDEWIDNLDLEVQGRIDAYIRRLSLGGSGSNIKALGNGIFEIRMDFGPGYRVYFAPARGFIILLFGGTKRGQSRDIERALSYWREYNEKNR